MTNDTFTEAREASKSIAKQIAKKLDLQHDEVSILLCSTDGETLRFLYPEALFKTGVKIPNDLNSLAGQAAYYQKSRVHNNLTEVKHMAFFERVKTGEAPPIPIQKMISIPIPSEKGPIGVIQCCRKAPSLQEAGPDFSKEDITTLEDELDDVAMMMSLLRPEDF